MMGTPATLDLLRDRHELRRQADERRMVEASLRVVGAYPLRDAERRLLDELRKLLAPFDTSALVLAAHRADPRRWGLPGAIEWPDSSRVKSDLMRRPGLKSRAKGWLARGLVRRVGKGRYAVGGQAG